MNIRKILSAEDEIQQKLVEMGREITQDYQGKDLLMVG
ncbi:MAG: hypoxanthine phosphoribosyltransferase, partial [Actinobacteria bacterium]